VLILLLVSVEPVAKLVCVMQADRREPVTTGPSSAFVRSFAGLAVTTFVLSVANPQAALCQDAIFRQNRCALSENLKPTKTVHGRYTEEAAKNNAEGTVVLCVTVDEDGEVTDVSPVSGPPELLQPSMDAARLWQFEPPSAAPAETAIEMTYNLTKPCPDGGEGMDVGTVTVRIGAGRGIEGMQSSTFEVVENVYQPLPPYPGKARAKGSRGQLNLSIIVAPDGRVVDAKIVKPLDELLDKLALDTVRTWQFKVSPSGQVAVFPVTLSFQIPCMSSAAEEQQSIDPPKVLIDDVDLQGAIHLPETVKEQLLTSLMHREYEETSDWIGDIEDRMVRAETEGWPDRENQGYLGFSVTARSKKLWREPGLLHVLVTIKVDEGQQKRLKAITFRHVGAPLVSAPLDSAEVRRLIPLNDGEVYNRDKFYAGMDAVSHAYHELGFIDMLWNSEMRFDQENQTVAIFVDLNEGQQHRPSHAASPW
jgi:TonB family protein